MKKLTLAFSSHRPETLPYAVKAMRGFPAVALEEPKNPDFAAMLSGQVSIDDYLMGTDFEYPAFARGLLAELRKLKARGADLFQVDPFMDELARIHERFAAGGAPGDIDPHTPAGEVYAAERAWTAALIDFYGISVTRPFEAVVSAVKNFAGADAARGRLRDRMRARALILLLQDYPSIYVEAGYIHQYLPYVLRRALPPGAGLERLWLMAPIVKEINGKTRVMGPGDALTVAYTFRPGFSGPAADLLAARSLIHVKALLKEEVPPTAEDPAPHTRDEIEVSRLVSRLSFEDCRLLFERMRGAGTSRSRRLLERYVPLP